MAEHHNATSPEGIALLKLSGRGPLNLLGRESFLKLNALLDQFEHDPKIRAVIVAGAGDRAFSAGVDLLEMKEFTPLEAESFIRVIHQSARKLLTFAVPTIAAIQGPCLGGALARIHRRTGMDGVRTAEGGEGVTGAMIRARIWVDGRLAGGLQALLGAPMAAYSGCGERDGGIGHGKRRSRTGLARVCGDVGLAGESVADGRRQAGSGRARNRARARSNWASQGQRCGRCSVRRRAERVIRPAREKNRRRRVLVVTTCSPRPMRAVQRARLWAITCTASQAALAAKRPEGRWFNPTPCLRSRMAFSISAWRRWSASSSSISPSRSVMKP